MNIHEQAAETFFRRRRGLSNPAVASAFFREEADRWDMASLAPGATAHEIKQAQEQAASYRAIARALENKR